MKERPLTTASLGSSEIDIKHLDVFSGAKYERRKFVHFSPQTKPLVLKCVFREKQVQKLAALF